MNGCSDSTGVGPPPTSSAPKHALDHHTELTQRPPKIARSSGEDLRIVHDSDDGGEVEEERKIDERGVELEKQSMNPRPGMQRYLIAIEYIGTRFFGSQQQPNCRTVVGALEEAFKKFIGQPVYVFCSSRTDAGVHALSNVCHVDVERISKRKPGEVLPPHEPSVVKRAINHFLQRDDPDVMVIDVRCVPPDFHARYKAQERTYYYRLLCGSDPVSVFEKDRAWHVPEELNLHAMQEACKVLVGCHDFSSFRAAGCQANSPVRTLEELRVFESVSTSHFSSPVGREQANFTGDKVSPSFDGQNTGSVASISNGSNLPFGLRKVHSCLVVTARARSFLYHQVRLLVGLLKCVGTGEVTISDVQRILDDKTVTAAKPMAPACGLYLGHVSIWEDVHAHTDLLPCTVHGELYSHITPRGSL